MTSRRPAVLVVALAPFVLGAGVGLATGPDQAPPPPGPLVEFARVEPAKPVVGRPVSFVIRVRDPAFAIRGLRIDTGERGGRRGGTACRIETAAAEGPFKPGTSVTIRVRFRFRIAGPRKVAFKVSSGGCAGAGLRFSGDVSVVVAPRPPSPTSVPVPAATPAQALCSHADTPTTQTDTAAVRSATMCLINAERRRRNASTLRRSQKLARAANSHTRDMVRRRFFEHEGPNGPSLTERLGRVRYKGRAGENIGYETGPSVTARSIVRGWLESPPHKANMLRRTYRAAGIGVSKRAPEGTSEPGGTFTADFGSS